MKVSIITPCLNSERYIGECMDSVKRQNYPDLEHVIIDGQSFDRTLEIINQRRKGYHVNLISEKDSGTSEAVEKGLKASTGELVAFVGSDDLLLPGAIARVVSEFSRRADADIVYGDGLLQPYGSEWASIYFNPSEELLPRHLRYNCFFDVGATFRKKVVEEIAYGKWKCAGDYEFFLKASERFKFAKVDSVLGCWRYRRGSLTWKSRNERVAIKKQNPSITSRIASLEGIQYYSKRLLSLMEREWRLFNHPRVSKARLLVSVMFTPFVERGQSYCGYLHRV